jgi:cell wall-associated NlpC family hydrolase
LPLDEGMGSGGSVRTVNGFTFSPVKFRPASRAPIDDNLRFKRERLALNARSKTPAIVGVANPYGGGAGAYEPNTEVYVPPAADMGASGEDLKVDPGGSENPWLKGYDDAYNAVQADKAQAAPNAPTGQLGSTASPSIPGIPTTGSVANIIAAAKTMLGKPYVWGGTTSAGVDCSGLIYYAFNQAGIKMPRYRAVDYGQMGHSVSAQEARAGDLIYWNNEGDVDHVGIYLGNGYVIQSPQTGDVTKISKVWGNAQYRRILDDKAFGQTATPTGAATSYNGTPANFYGDVVSIAAPVNFSRKGQF